MTQPADCRWPRCQPGAHVLACPHYHDADVAAWSLGMLGFALAGPAATERACAIVDMYRQRTTAYSLSVMLRGGRL